MTTRYYGPSSKEFITEKLHEEGSLFDMVEHSVDNLCDIFPDLGTVFFSFENSCFKDYYVDEFSFCGLKKLVHDDEFSYALYCNAAGDWESTIHFIIYWDGERLMAYIPCRGNVYNPIAKCAFGSEDMMSDDDDLVEKIHHDGLMLKLSENHDTEFIEEHKLCDVEDLYDAVYSLESMAKETSEVFKRREDIPFDL